MHHRVDPIGPEPANLLQRPDRVECGDTVGRDGEARPDLAPVGRVRIQQKGFDPKACNAIVVAGPAIPPPTTTARIPHLTHSINR